MSSKRVPKLKKRKEQVADKAPQPPSKRVAGIFAPSILEVYGEDNLSMVPPLLVAGLTTTVGKQEADDADNVGHCRCLKSRCLKLYCDCFVSGLLCSKGCKCEKNCQNNDATEENRAARIEAILYNVKTNPITFRRLKRYNSASNVVVGAPSRKKGPGQQCSCIKTQCLKVSNAWRWCYVMILHKTMGSTNGPHLLTPYDSPCRNSVYVFEMEGLVVITVLVRIA